MNQILTVEQVEKKRKEKEKKIKTGRPVEIKGIIKFFAIAILTFGITFIGQGSYAIYREIEDKNPINLPTVMIHRENDKCIVQVQNNIEISKLVYSWNNGEKTAIPVGSTTAEEEITLLGYDSTLNITIEDINGKSVKYQKQFILTGEDITKPSIEFETEDGNENMTIIAKDETAISYIQYQWDNEEPITVDATQENQQEIKQQVPLTVGTKKIKIIAVDANNNIEKIEKEIVTSTSKPKVVVKRDKQKISIEAEDTDGIKDIVVNLNGKEESVTNINRKSVKVGYLYLREGNNTLSIEVTNVNGYTEKATAELQYTP